MVDSMKHSLNKIVLAVCIKRIYQRTLRFICRCQSSCRVQQLVFKDIDIKEVYFHGRIEPQGIRAAARA
jgi:hypothetical protein